MRIFLVGTVASSVFGFRRSLMEELVRRGNEVVIYLSEEDAAISRRAKQELSVTVRQYPLARAGINPISDIRSLVSLYNEFRRERPDCVFGYFSKPVIWAGIASWLARVPRRIGMLEGLGYSFTQQPGGVTSVKRRLLKAAQLGLYSVALPRLTKLVFLNPDDPVDLLDAHHIRVQAREVLGGIGVDLQALRYSPPPILKVEPRAALTPTFIFVGRLLAEKGINEYIAAARLVKAEFPEARFVVLGGLDAGNPGSLSQAELDAFVAQDLIEHPGYVDCVADWLAGADVFVLPSYYREGVPASTQEAMAIGRAVITTDVPGCRETVIDGVNGFLVPPWSAERLAKKMLYLIERPHRIGEMGKQSRRIAEEKFDAVEVNRRLCELLGA